MGHRRPVLVYFLILSLHGIGLGLTPPINSQPGTQYRPQVHTTQVSIHNATTGDHRQKIAIKNRFLLTNYTLSQSTLC